MADLIRIEKGDTLKTITSLLEKAEGVSVYVAFDDDWTPLAQMHSLKVLKGAADTVGKKIVVMSEDAGVRSRARKVGFAAVGGQESFFKNSGPKQRPRRSDISSVKAQPRKTAPRKATPEKAKQSGRTRQSPAHWVAADNHYQPEPSTGFSSGTKKALFVTSMLLAIVAGFLATTFIFQRATVTVFARTQTSAYGTDVIVDKNAIASSDNTLIGTPINANVSEEGTFQASGAANQGQTASGTIVLHSSHRFTLALGQQTTYLASGAGHRYRFTSEVRGLRPNVPMTVEIVAEQPGQESNLEAGARLEVHNAVLGYQPTVLYATVSETGIKGGTSEVVTTVSESDLINAKESLRKQMVEKIAQQLTSEIGEKMMVLDSLVALDNAQESSSVPAGEQAEKFDFELKADITGIAFKQSDFENFLKKDFSQKGTPTQMFLNLDNGAYEYSLRSWDPVKGIAVFNVNYKVNWYAQIDDLSMKTLLANRSIPEIKDVLLDKPEIAGVGVSLSPFWLKKTPKSANKIDIDVEVK